MIAYLVRLVFDAKVVHAGEALRYYREETPDEKRVDIADFPNLRPPFEKFFVEGGGLPVLAFTSPDLGGG
jgi:hypothetical protein